MLLDCDELRESKMTECLFRPIEYPQQDAPSHHEISLIQDDDQSENAEAHSLSQIVEEQMKNKPMNAKQCTYRFQTARGNN